MSTGMSRSIRALAIHPAKKDFPVPTFPVIYSTDSSIMHKGFHSLAISCFLFSMLSVGRYLIANFSIASLISFSSSNMRILPNIITLLKYVVYSSGTTSSWEITQKDALLHFLIASILCPVFAP